MYTRRGKIAESPRASSSCSLRLVPRVACTTIRRQVPADDTSRLAAKLVVLMTSAAVVALLVAEAATRLLDGYPLTTLRLPLFAPELATVTRPDPAQLAAAVGGAPDADPRWIDDAPAHAAPRADPALLALRSRHRHPEVPEYNLYFVWNAAFVNEQGCTDFGADPAILRFLPQPLIVFDPPDGSTHPPYRQLPGTTTPLGLTTNRFGFRGPEIALDKPPRTVRLAFLGASTTLGFPIYPLSYPEYVGHWLNRWAERAGQDVRFEIINAGRAGISSTDIAAVARDEVIPLEPDLVLYYEGANQFVLDPSTNGSAAAARWTKGLPPGTWIRLRIWPSQYSALVRRIDRLIHILAARGGQEPAKPGHPPPWPDGVDEQSPDITRADLPLSLPVILHDLDTIHAAVERDGGELALASFVWLARDGLRLDPVRQAPIYEMLNGRFWPYRYSDVRRMADFQNRVFARYAAAHGVPFIDVAGVFPQDPALFLDAIHFNHEGTRLQAWIVFQALLPLVRDRLASGTWPRPDRVPLATHPAFSATRAYTVPCAR